MLGEQEFTNSVIKPIIERSNTSNEILSDLKVDTVYLVGVLLITDDGNFNDQDIVYGQFQTSCIRTYSQ
jgi:endothelial-specific receptor tyrosine kinase